MWPDNSGGSRGITWVGLWSFVCFVCFCLASFLYVLYISMPVCHACFCLCLNVSQFDGLSECVLICVCMLFVCMCECALRVPARMCMCVCVFDVHLAIPNVWACFMSQRTRAVQGRFKSGPGDKCRKRQHSFTPLYILLMSLSPRP